MTNLEAEPPAGGLYALAWYNALHWGDHLTMSLLPDAAEVLAQQQGNRHSPARWQESAVWILKSGEFFAARDEPIYGTENPFSVYYLNNLLSKARRLVASRNPLFPGTLENDPKLAAFFTACGSTTCEVTFPDQTVLRVQAPSEINPNGLDNSGILLYNIEKFGGGQPTVKRVTANYFFSQAKQVLNEVKQGNGVLDWASKPTGITPDPRPSAYPALCLSGLKSRYKRESREEDEKGTELISAKIAYASKLHACSVSTRSQ